MEIDDYGHDPEAREGYHQGQGTVTDVLANTIGKLWGKLVAERIQKHGELYHNRAQRKGGHRFGHADGLDKKGNRGHCIR